MALKEAELRKECLGRRASPKLVTTGRASKSSWENNDLSSGQTDRADRHQALVCELHGSKRMPDMMDLMIIVVGNRAYVWGHVSSSNATWIPCGSNGSEATQEDLSQNMTRESWRIPR